MHAFYPCFAKDRMANNFHVHKSVMLFNF